MDFKGFWGLVKSEVVYIGNARHTRHKGGSSRMANGGGRHCSICQLTLGESEPRVIAVVSSNGNGKKGEEQEVFCMSIDGFKQVVGVSELRAGVVPGLKPIGKKSWQLNLGEFTEEPGNHVQKLAVQLPAHLVRQFLPVLPAQKTTTNGLCVIQA